jgi:hypothetical protein
MPSAPRINKPYEIVPTAWWRPPGLRHPVDKLSEYMSGLTLTAAKGRDSSLFSTIPAFPVTAVLIPAYVEIIPGSAGTGIWV